MGASKFKWFGHFRVSGFDASSGEKTCGSTDIALLRLAVALALLLFLDVGMAQALEISGTSPVTVVMAADATLAEQTAAQEVAYYLSRVTGATVTLVAEGSSLPPANRIFIGPTRAAARLKIAPSTLGPEEWVIRTAATGNSPSLGRPRWSGRRFALAASTDLYLLGGRPRGTLYAAYHFLEDVVGVRWWTPWEETVPRRPVLRLGVISLRGEPGFNYRDLHMSYGNDGGRFAARSRLNRDGDARITGPYGGSLDYGPPYHVHTAFLYFPPSEYFALHPEWYSLIDGQRTWEGGQLCWTNTELRQALVAKLLDSIAYSRWAWPASNLPPPQMFSISQADGGRPCQCEQCQAIAVVEGSEVAPLLDCVNYAADAVRSTYPDVLIDTLAYEYGLQPPATMMARDNVVVRFTGTHNNVLRPIEEPGNQSCADLLLAWAGVTQRLRVWDYAVTYGPGQGMPLPTTQTFGPDCRFYASHGVEGMFSEMENPILADLRDLKVWCLAKLLEDPEADGEALTDAFLNGYYGSAGPTIKQYLEELEAEAVECDTVLTCYSRPKEFTYLNLDFINRAHALFDEAERVVAADPVLTRRVRHARLPLDRATLLLYLKLLSDWQNQGRDPARFPPDRTAVAERTLDTWYAQIDLRLPSESREAERAVAAAETNVNAVMPANYDLPTAFQGYPPGTVLDYTAIMFRAFHHEMRITADPEAESGITNRLDLTAPDLEQRERYALPMSWQLFSYPDGAWVGSNLIWEADVPGPGYHWYRMGAFPLAPTYCVNFFWNGILQLDTCEYAFDPTHPDQQFEIWARVKFEGPSFPYARDGQTDAISVERVVLVKTE